MVLMTCIARCNTIKMVCVFDEPRAEVAVLPGDLECDLLRRRMDGDGISGGGGGGGERAVGVGGGEGVGGGGGDGEFL